MKTGRDEGHALVEAVLIGLLLVVPVVWLLSTLSTIHAAALATASAAREAGFEAARAADISAAKRGIAAASAEAMADHGLEPDRATIRWAPDQSWARGGTIQIEVTYRVPVVAAPFLGTLGGPSIPVSAQHVARIDPYRSR